MTDNRAIKKLLASDLGSEEASRNHSKSFVLNNKPIKVQEDDPSRIDTGIALADISGIAKEVAIDFSLVEDSPQKSNQGVPLSARNLQDTEERKMRDIKLASQRSSVVKSDLGGGHNNTPHKKESFAQKMHLRESRSAASKQNKSKLALSAHALSTRR